MEILGFSTGIRVLPVDPCLIPSDDPRHEGWVIQSTLMEILTDFGTKFLLIGGQKPGHELCSNAVHDQIRRYNCLYCSVWHMHDGSNVISGSPTILMHKSLNCFEIFGGLLNFVIIQWCSAALEVFVPFETPWPTFHCSIAIHMTKHVKSLSYRIWCSLTTLVCSPWWIRKCARARGHWNSRSVAHDVYSDITRYRHIAWRQLLLIPTARWSPYCHLLACYRSSLKTFCFDTTSYICFACTEAFGRVYLRVGK